MVECVEKKECKKEYTKPQMEVMAMEVVRFLCGSDEGLVECEGPGCPS